MGLVFTNPKFTTKLAIIKKILGLRQKRHKIKFHTTKFYHLRNLSFLQTVLNNTAEIREDYLKFGE